MYCPDCGNQTVEGRRYCTTCGCDLGLLPLPTPLVSPGRRTSRADVLGPMPSGGTTPAESVGEWATSLPASDIAAFAPGSVVAGRYEVQSFLGKGGMGAVYRVHDRDLGEGCALKILHPILMASGRAVGRFTAEARVARRLTHPGIVRVHDIGRRDGLHYLSMELLEGRSLRTWLMTLRREERLAPVDVTISVGLQVLDALAYAHRTIVHRDIKPENIFLLDAEVGFTVKLLDFGIAKLLDRELLTATRTSMGTAGYMAPEQVEDAATVDCRADLYGVGAVLYEMLSGSEPYGMLAMPSQERPELAAGWDELVLSAMSRDPARRPADAQAMARLLRALGQLSSPERVIAAERPRNSNDQTLETAGGQLSPATRHQTTGPSMPSSPPDVRIWQEGKKPGNDGSWKWQMSLSHFAGSRQGR